MRERTAWAAAFGRADTDNNIRRARRAGNAGTQMIRTAPMACRDTWALPRAARFALWLRSRDRRMYTTFRPARRAWRSSMTGRAPAGHCDQSHEVALAFNHVHRNDLLRESMIVAGQAAKMQLSDRYDPVAAVAQAVMPARYRAFISIRIVPVANLVDILPDRECSARRHTDRTRGVCARKRSARCCKCVDVRRFYDRMPVTTHDLWVVLIGHDDYEIGRLH